MPAIRVSENSRHFVDEGGQPFFWLGDTQWELVREFEPQEAGALLAARRAQGFTAVQVMLTGTGDGGAANIAGDAPWEGDDPARPNERYFRHVDRVIEVAGQVGFIVVLGVYHQAQVDRFTDAKARAYARWVGARYARSPQVIWTMYPKAKVEYAGVCGEIAAGLLQADREAGTRQLITVHPDPSPTSSSFLHDEPWLDFNMSQPCISYELIHKMVSEDYGRVPAKPIVMAEGGYEGEEFGRVQTALEIRKQAYWSHLAGGHHSYGHMEAWKAPRRWRQWVDSAGARCLSVYRDVLVACPRWWGLIPDQSIFASDAGSDMTLNVAGRSAEGDWLLAYLASNRPVCLQLSKLTAGRNASVTWINPADGKQMSIGGVCTTGAGEFTPPAGWEDALLLVRTDA